jgi:hypothetical protein
VPNSSTVVSAFAGTPGVVVWSLLLHALLVLQAHLVLFFVTGVVSVSAVSAIAIFLLMHSVPVFLAF